MLGVLTATNDPLPFRRISVTSGMLRHYLPKSVDLRIFTQGELDAIADRLNGRPRQTLGWQTPSEALTEALC